MPYYYDGRSSGYDLGQYACREFARHSHRPTQYVINEGNLVVDERMLNRYYDRHHKYNTVIYNAPGSRMRIEYSRHHYGPYYSGSGESGLLECLRCRRRSRCYGGYCPDCIAVRVVEDRGRDRRSEILTVDERRRFIEYPERRALK
ncbi:hypothetical protein F5Y16DRAFT_173553 [Xylariaceae sp. FL0255]|nr:hypothetical protein F5Y16DRAFT_173553 [Xylariaceae sp. FL0255]